MQQASGLPVYDKPELLREPSATCLRVAILWWEGNVPDGLMGDVKRVTRRVNGGTVGLADRMALTDDAAKALA